MKLVIVLFMFAQTALALNPGDRAIDFSLEDQDDQLVKLSKYKGNFIVLEWFNHGCPYVKKHYGSKNMQTLQNLYQSNKLVTWITIVSSAEGKQGYLKNTQEMKAKISELKMNMDHLVRDIDGKVGKSYGAKTTPHIFIIDPKFKIRYVGAIDSESSSDVADIAKAKNYVSSAMSKLMLQDEPNPAKTRPYGCSVKY